MDALSPLVEVLIFKRGQKTKLSKNFSLAEFECSCGKCPFTLISMVHIERLQELRQSMGAPIKINSAYRCYEYNKSIGGAPYSQHCFGTATDISVENMRPKDLHSLCEDFDGVGLYDTFVHVDSRGYSANWDNRNGKE